jgi:acetyl esterase/lipase
MNIAQVASSELLDHVDPDLRESIAALPDLGELSEESLPRIRGLISGTAPTLGVAHGIDVSWITIPGLDNEPDTRALLYRPVDADGPLPAILNIHGGGFVSGSAQREDAEMRKLVGEMGCIALSPEYRLAPEVPYPGPFFDCLAAIEALHALAEVDSARVAVRGVSAGGGLALALGLAARDGQTREISHLTLVYPMLDDRTGPHPVTGQFVWTGKANCFAWTAFLANVDRSEPPPYAVPARARDFIGVPPVFIGVGSIDLFAQEALSVAGRMICDGVSVELHLYPGAYHGFNLIEDSRAAKAFRRDSYAAIKRNLHIMERKLR